MANFLASMGVIASEVKLKETKNGNVLAECFVFFNDYIPGVGKTSLQVNVTVWGDKARWLVEQAKAHKNRSGSLTNGKGMPMFFVGYTYTHQYTGRNGEQRETRMQAVDVQFSETPTLNATGVIGSEVKPPRTVNTKNGPTSVGEFLVFFNGFIPGMGKTAFESYVTVWGDTADWVYKQAQAHKRKDGTPTNGKGMAMNFVCCVYTNKYTKDGVDHQNTRLTAVDVKFPQSVFGSASAKPETASADTDTRNAAPAAASSPAPVKSAAPETNSGFDDSSETGDVLAAFDEFLQTYGV